MGGDDETGAEFTAEAETPVAFATKDLPISKTRKLLWASVTLWRSIATDIYPPPSVVLWVSSGLL